MVSHKCVSHVGIGRRLICLKIVVENVCVPRVCRRGLELEFRGCPPVGAATAGTGEVGQGDSRDIPELPEDPDKGAEKYLLPQRGANGRLVRVEGREGSFGCQPLKASRRSDL